MAEVSRPELPRIRQHSIPEHEVVLAFEGDSDAVLFSDWWQDHGFSLFAEWARGIRD